MQLAAGIKELLPNTGATLTERLLDRDNTAAVNKAVRPRKTTKDDKKGTRRCVGRTAKDEQCRYDAPEGQDRCNRPHHH